MKGNGGYNSKQEIRAPDFNSNVTQKVLTQLPNNIIGLCWLLKLKLFGITSHSPNNNDLII